VYWYYVLFHAFISLKMVPQSLKHVGGYKLLLCAYVGRNDYHPENP